MKDLFTVVKEATNAIRKKYLPDNGQPFTDAELEDIQKIITETYKRQSFWWKIKNTPQQYVSMIKLDIAYDFIGGATIKKKGDTIIQIQ